MVDKSKFTKVFEEKLKNAIETERTEMTQHFRICVDQKDNIFLANLSSQYSSLSGEFVPSCPSDTKKTIDVVMTSIIERYRSPPKMYESII